MKIAGLFILLIILFLIWFDQSRSFYCMSNDKCITVWKRLGNKCYIIPGKYYGILKPSDYVKTTNDNALTIIFDDLSGYDFVIFNDYGKELEVNLSKERIKYFKNFERDIFIDEFYVNERIKDNLPYLQIDIKEGLVVINGVKQ
ncbi:hypothetical protein [Schleiferia thermophila]|jgi:hypothetical protein|nr:hypothetical protein [Schleiferia thermophila]